MVEADGGHALRASEDAERTRIIEAHGYSVVRYWNSDVTENLDGVQEDILGHLRIATNR